MAEFDGAEIGVLDHNSADMIICVKCGKTILAGTNFSDHLSQCVTDN